jgi:hypothetical protein
MMSKTTNVGGLVQCNPWCLIGSIPNMRVHACRVKKKRKNKTVVYSV